MKNIYLNSATRSNVGFVGTFSTVIALCLLFAIAPMQHKIVVYKGDDLSYIICWIITIAAVFLPLFIASRAISAKTVSIESVTEIEDARKNKLFSWIIITVSWIVIHDVILQPLIQAQFR